MANADSREKDLDRLQRRHSKLKKEKLATKDAIATLRSG